MKRAIGLMVLAISAFLTGCGKDAPTTKETGPSPNKADLGRPSPAGALEDAKTPQEKAALIHKWMDAKMSPKLLRPAVEKYLKDPDPDVAAAAREAYERK